jgi:putative DNA primase/helicase
LQDNPDIIQSNGGLYKYNGKCYDLLTDKNIDTMFQTFCIKYDTTKSWKFLGMVVRAFWAYPEIKEVELLNDYEGLLCFNNGVLNIYTKELSPHSPDFYFDSYIGVDYDPDATKCPVFVNYLNNTFNDDQETITNIVRLGGYLMDTSCAAERMFLFDGSGANGKSVLINTFQLFFSEDQISPLSLDVLATNSFSKELLIKSRVNFCAEQKKSMLEAEEIKKIITGDKIEINRKFKISLSFTPKTKLIVACNGKPRFSDTTHAIYRRMLLIQFHNQYLTELEYKRIKNPDKMHVYPKDKDLFEKIKAEKTAILNLFIGGLLDLRSNNYEFIESADSVSSMDEFRRDNDSVREFLEDNYELSDIKETSLRQVFDHYRQWYRYNVQDSGIMKFRKNEMGKRIKDIMGVSSLGQKYIFNSLINATERETIYPITLREELSPAQAAFTEGATEISMEEFEAKQLKADI